jgi:hypothetical protein
MTDETAPQKILWMVEYTVEGTQYHRLEPIYASSREEAELAGRAFIAQHGQKATLIAVRPYPHGFVVKYRRVPGNLSTIEDAEAPEESDPP